MKYPKLIIVGFIIFAITLMIDIATKDDVKNALQATSQISE